MILHIVRKKTLSSSTGQFGSLSIDGQPFCFTCEQPWNDNTPNASSIPTGNYQVLPFQSPAHGPTYVFHNPALGIYGTPNLIPHGQLGRSLCELHNANWPFQLRGCVAVGDSITNIDPNGLGVTNSVNTFHALIGRLMTAGGAISATISNSP